MGLVFNSNLMYNKGMEEIEIQIRNVVAEAQRAQLENPTRAVVNSESAFVAQRLRNDGYTGVAARYWSWACSVSCGHENRTEFGDEVYELELALRQIDKGISMPAWGTYGT